MELKPSQKKLSLAMDKRSEYFVLLLATAIFLIIGLIIFSTGWYPFTALGIIGISGFQAYRLYKKWLSYRESITDISRSKMYVDDEFFYCMQVSKGDAYQSCDARIEDIESVAEDTKNSGFFIFLKQDADISGIAFNGIASDLKIMHCTGSFYENDEFIAFFDKLTEILRNKGVKVEATEKHKSWIEKTPAQEVLSNLLPYFALIIATIIHIVLSFR